MKLINHIHRYFARRDFKRGLMPQSRHPAYLEEYGKLYQFSEEQSHFTESREWTTR